MSSSPSVSTRSLCQPNLQVCHPTTRRWMSVCTSHIARIHALDNERPCTHRPHHAAFLSLVLQLHESVQPCNPHTPMSCVSTRGLTDTSALARGYDEHNGMCDGLQGHKSLRPRHSNAWSTECTSTNLMGNCPLNTRTCHAKSQANDVSQLTRALTTANMSTCRIQRRQVQHTHTFAAKRHAKAEKGNRGSGGCSGSGCWSCQSNSRCSCR